MPIMSQPRPSRNLQLGRGKRQHSVRNPKIKISPEPYHNPEEEDRAQTWA